MIIFQRIGVFGQPMREQKPSAGSVPVIGFLIV
jgi:hypothetical protein